MSFRLRLILIITAVPFFAMLVLIIILAKDFEQDKIAYIYELQDETLRRAEAYVLKVIKSDSDWSMVYSFQNNAWVPNVQEAAKSETAKTLLPYSGFLCTSAQKYSYFSAADKSLWLAHCENGTTLSILSWNKLKEIFSARSLQSLYLIHRSGLLLYSENINLVGQNLNQLMPEGVEALNSDMPVSKFETSYEKENIQIGTLAPIPGTPLLILSLTPKKAAERAALPFLFKGILVLFVIVISVLVISVFLSQALVSRIKVLLDAFSKYGEGHQELRLKVESKSKDEFQQLNSGFNLMADHIQTLISDKEKSAANEHEMKLAGDVQKMFFPYEETQFGTSEVQGFVWPASQCGGDWWYVTKYQQKLIVILGDVTGHGFTSALMTSAGRAIVSKIEQKFTSLEDIAEEMSHAMFSLSKGAFQMTFYGLVIDPTEKTLHILNCSHEPLFIQRKEGFVYNSNCHGSRLGEKENLKFEGETIPLEGIEMLAIFSDGLREIHNPKGRKMGEVRLAKILGKAAELSFNKRLTYLKEEISKFQNEAPLQDDVSIVVIKP